MPDVQLVLPNGRHHLMRTLRAAWRDTSALWREFRRPILAFLIAMFGGGWLYGELLVAAGYPRVPLPRPALHDGRPDDPSRTRPTSPPEPYLVAFWYRHAAGRPLRRRAGHHRLSCACSSIAASGAPPGRKLWHRPIAITSSLWGSGMSARAYCARWQRWGRRLSPSTSIRTITRCPT